MKKMFHPDKEPQFQFNDGKRSLDEAKEWARQKYGEDDTIETYNTTSIFDDCDVFILCLPLVK